VRSPALARPAARFTGVIDTLSAGYGVINRHPWLLLLPIGLDLFLWRGPQLSAGRLVSRTIGQALVPGPGGAPLRIMGQAQARDLVDAVEGFNLLSALVPAVVGLPSFAATLGVRDPLRSVQIDSWTLALAIVIGAVLGGMLVGSLYDVLLAQEVRDGRVSVPRLPGQAVRSWVRLLLYVALLGGLAVLFGLPLGALAAGAALASPVLGSLVLSTVTLGSLWVGLYLFFVPNAIVLSQVGPLQAIRNSVAVVRLSLWPSVAVAGLITVVLLGMGQVWDLAARRLADPWGVVVGVLGNAYIASGLIAATMLFYQERIEFLRPAGQAASEE
jgi:hypothetical protein